MRSATSDRVCKLLAAVAFVLIACALLVAGQAGAASGYEISIYAAYPPYFWAFVISALALGMAILVIKAFSNDASRWWLIGLAIVVLSNTVVLLLPLLRGYVGIGLFDPQNHVGYVREIMLTGHLGTVQENFYPASHLLVSSIGSVTGMDIELVMMTIPALFYAFYIVSMYLLGGELAETRGQQLLITALAASPIFIQIANETNAYFVPRNLVFMLFPFILYAFFRLRRAPSSQNAAVMIVALVAAPFWHPVNGGAIPAALFLAVGLAMWLWKRFSDKRTQEPLSSFRPSSVMNPALLVVTVWLLWFLPKSMFSNMVLQLRDALFFGTAYGRGTETEAGLYFGWLGRSQIPLSDVMVLLLKKQGAQLPYFAAAGVIGLSVWGRLLFSKARSSPSVAAFSALFLCAVAVFLGFAIFQVPFESTRIIPFLVLFATVVCGLGLYRLFSRYHHRTTVTCVFMAVLVLTSTLGVLNTYSSPFTLGANDQVTLADRKGIEWYIDNGLYPLLADDIVMSQFSLGAAARGWSGITEVVLRAPGFSGAKEPGYSEAPDHFGYDEHGTFGASYPDDRYFLSHQMARVYYTERMQKYPEGWRWTPEDFARLESDPTVRRLYDNGGFEVFYVTGTATQSQPPDE